MSGYQLLDRTLTLVAGLTAIYAGSHHGLNRLIASQTAPKPLIITKPTAPIKKKSFIRALFEMFLFIGVELTVIHLVGKFKSDWIANLGVLAFWFVLGWQMLSGYKHMFPSSSIMKWTSSGLTFQTVYQSVTFAWSPQGTPVFNYPKPEPKWTIKSTLDFLKSPFFVLGGFFAIYATNLLSRSDLGGGLEIDLLKAFISFVVMIFSAVIVHAGLKPMTAGLSLPGHSMRILFYIFGGSHAIVLLIFGIGFLLNHLLPMQMSAIGAYLKVDPEENAGMMIWPWVSDITRVFSRWMCLMFPAFFATFALRLDWAVYQDSTDFNTISPVPHSPAPTAIPDEKSDSAIISTKSEPTEETLQICIPFKSPIFPRPYFATTAFAIAIFQMLAIGTTTEAGEQMMFGLGAAWAAMGTIFVMACGKGHLKTLWNYEESWKLPATPPVNSIED